MYAEKEKIAKAKQYKHMTFYEAAEVAKKAEVAEMWLTHFSPSLVHAEDYMPQVREIFPNAFLVSYTHLKLPLAMHYKDRYLWIGLAILIINCMVKNIVRFFWGVSLL